MDELIDKPVDKPADEPMDKPTDASVDKPADQQHHIVGVRYGLMMATEQFVCYQPDLSIGARVIVRTMRGVDFGEVVTRPKAVPHEPRGLGEFMRLARPEDEAIIRHIRENKEPDEFKSGQEAIQARDLPMKLVGVEHLFSGDKIIFYFTADGRVDFRELVKDLARRYRTRIEMRQIGVRDEARVLADYEHCGRELCCRTFIRNLEPVTMRMAKTQKTTLDPTKISGRCGRLMCCLRFEDAVYTQLQAEMPPRGCIVVTEKFTGEVVAQDIMRQQMTVALADGTRETVTLLDVKEVRRRPRSDNASPGGKPPARQEKL
jgi:cell fate regulator YaaT (PSP1 superfamily)